MLLGIKKKKISQMFLIENLLIGLLSLVLAIPIGFIVSQFMSMVIVSILGLPQAIFIELNVMSILLLLLYFAIIYVLVLFRANHRMKKINIHDLLCLEKQNEQKITKKKKHRNIIFVISLIIGIAGLVVWNSQWTLDNAGNQSTPNYLILSMALIIISIYGVMISVADFILAFILNNKKIKYKKDNLFVARTFSSKARTMGFTLGTLTMLITLTLFFLNISSFNKGMYDYQISMEAPYEVTIADKRKYLPEYLEVIKEDYFIYDIYKDKSANILKTMSSYDYKGDDKKFDPVIKISDYNKLLELKGKKPITINNDEYTVITDMAGESYINEFPSFKEITLSNGIKLKQKEIITEDYWLRLSNTSYTLILPDDAISNLEIDESHLIVNTTENTKAELETKIEDRMAFIFIATVGTILAIQSLTDSTKYKYRYNVLNRLGVKKEQIYKTVRKQLLVLFGLPIIYPTIISFCLLSSINNFYKPLLSSEHVYLSYYFGGLAIFLVVYIIYYIATYFEFKRNLKES